MTGMERGIAPMRVHAWVCFATLRARFLSWGLLKVRNTAFMEKGCVATTHGMIVYSGPALEQGI